MQSIGQKGTRKGDFEGSIFGVHVTKEGVLLTTDYENHRIQFF